MPSFLNISVAQLTAPVYRPGEEFMNRVLTTSTGEASVVVIRPAVKADSTWHGMASDINCRAINWLLTTSYETSSVTFTMLFRVALGSTPIIDKEMCSKMATVTYLYRRNLILKKSKPKRILSRLTQHYTNFLNGFQSVRFDRWWYRVIIKAYLSTVHECLL